ncbi:Crp/Fnr family transcriptional regulator [Asanoa siamensis]|uniref:Crp/Fnr family transcriptional regulator n=1 Tax=Asanoa siamensis TaxID=926357 RepID=UPI001945A403|nr:Crp/Fnr family transcriptional regulator [Asanoa siamensis]
MGPREWHTYAPGSFVGRLRAPEREALFRLGTTRELTAGRHLLVEGRTDGHVEVIRRGYVKVTTLVGGVSRLLAIRLAGDIVGEFAAITGQGRSATVTTCGPVVSTVVGRVAFLRFIDAHPRAASQVTATVGERLRWANARRSEFSAFPVHVRLARVLSDIATSCGERADDGVHIAVELNQAELAALVGAAEDTVQRALRMLRDLGVIGTGYRHITVRNLAALRGLADR